MSPACNPASDNAAASAARAAFSISTPACSRPRPRTTGAMAALVSPRTTAFTKADPTSIPATCRIGRPPQVRLKRFPRLFEGKERRADGAGEVRILTNLQFRPEDVFERLYPAGISRY